MKYLYLKALLYYHYDYISTLPMNFIIYHLSFILYKLKLVMLLILIYNHIYSTFVNAHMHIYFYLLYIYIYITLKRSPGYALGIFRMSKYSFQDCIINIRILQQYLLDMARVSPQFHTYISRISKDVSPFNL